MSNPSFAPLLTSQTLAWSESKRGKPSSSVKVDERATAVVDLRGSSGPTKLKEWVHQAIRHYEKDDQQMRLHNIRLRPIASMIKNEAKADDSLSVISVARSFGLSTTTGARGDAVSYVLQMSDDESGAYAVHGVVKVVKSQATFQQECAALTIIRNILPTPIDAYYPCAIAASLAYIPTTIPTTADGASSFARPYSVSALSSSTTGSTSSSMDGDTCKGGLLLMECAPGHPLAHWFKLVASSPIGSIDRQTHRAELHSALRAAARALAELHSRTSAKGGDSSDSHPFIQETARQMNEMLQKLGLEAYAETKKKWGIEVEPMEHKLNQLKESVLKNPGVCCIIHGDAHAGNMLWHVPYQRLTLIDLPTMLAAIQVEEHDSNIQLPTGGVAITSVHNSNEADISPNNQQTPATHSSSSSSSSSPPRHSAVCTPPSLTSQLLLRGVGLAGRDVAHFERKLDSFGTIAGMEPDEVDQMTDIFHSTYVEHGETITEDAMKFFQYRSLLGEVTQLVRHDPNAIKKRIIQQLSNMLGNTHRRQN